MTSLITHLRAPVAFRMLAVALVACSSASAGCGGPSNVYSWKPTAASAPRARPRPVVSVAEPSSDQAGADILEDVHRQTKVTWVAVPSPDGRKTVWVQVK